MAEIISNGVKTSSSLQCDGNNEVLIEVTVEVEVHPEEEAARDRKAMQDLRGYRSTDTHTHRDTHADFIGLLPAVFELLGW